MTHQKWEYASVIWTESARKIFKSDPDFEQFSPAVKAECAAKGWDYWFTQKIYIWLPGATKADEQVVWETNDEETRVRLFDVFNEMGADGWEMVNTVIDNHAMGRSLGRETTSYPTRKTTRFKRPVVEGR